MFKKILKVAAAAGMLGGGIFAADQLSARFLSPVLPDNFKNWIASSRTRLWVYQYGVGALGALTIVPLAAGMLGLSAKSPIKAEASPLKA